MRQINDHMKDVIGTKTTPSPNKVPFEGVKPKPKQPKPSFNPLKWNWTAIVTWTVIGVITFNLFKYLFNLI